MTNAEWITVAALFAGPVIAVQLSELLTRRRAKHDRRLHVFRTLMATRATRVSREHVAALNMIDLEFDEQDDGDKAVRDAWKVYLDHLSNKTEPLNNWVQKGSELFVE